MPCIKSLLLTSLRFATNLLPLPHESNNQLDEVVNTLPVEPVIEGSFKDALSSVPESSIHAALHEHLPQVFKDGMFEHDSSAVEVVHRTNAPLATKLLAAARYDLLRRQNGNLTTTSVAAPPPVVVPVTVTSTDASGGVVTSVATALSSATVSVATTLTTTNAAGQTTLLATQVPAAVVTNANGQVTTAPAPTLNPQGNLVLTTTDAQGSVYVTTITPSGGVYSSFVVETTTLPDGSRSTFTSLTVVPAPTGSSSGGPHLQGGAGSLKTNSVTLSGLLVAAVTLGAFFL
jgi:hypothetical protein